MARVPLNPAQKRAAEHQNGPLLVLAGAGSGKTRVITERVANLLSKGVPARAILALTFTNKAAAEMRDRIGDLLREEGSREAARDLTISTFHSFGLSVLARERAAIGGAFTVFDQGDAIAAVKEALRAVGADRKYDVAAVLSRISLAKNAFLEPHELPEDDAYDEITRIVYPKYLEMLRAFRAYDFDDLVCEVARLWKTRSDVLERWQDRYRYVLVDEYQDTNRAQLELLLQLAKKHRNVCVVGDDDQAIYAWRGADVRNILDFEAHFPGAEVVKLEQNYRSRRPILDVANAVIAKRTDAKYRKSLFTDKAGGDTVESIACATPEVEAGFVADEIRRLVRDARMKPSQFAVLYRSNGQAKLVEEALREHGIPYRMVGGTQFFERKEVKDVLAYLKLALNRNDEISLRRVVNYPARGIGETSVAKLATVATARGWTLWQAVERADAIDGLPSSARDGCRELERTIADVRRALLVERRPASEVTRALVDRIGLKHDLDVGSGSAQAAARRWGNVEGLVQTFRKRELRAAQSGRDPTGEDGLRQFLQMLTLDMGGDGEDESLKDVVTLSTLHGSKGLEFDVVFLIGCEEGYLPHQRTLDPRATEVDPGDGPNAGAASIEEERRLFYVGVTRARERLVLLRCKNRVSRGKAVARTPSRFLLDVPAELLVERDVDRPPHMSDEAMAEQANALLAALDALG
jgi:DNA helicase-2/ATP-dependent DNA helicase PcrA